MRLKISLLMMLFCLSFSVFKPALAGGTEQTISPIVAVPVGFGVGVGALVSGIAKLAGASTAQALKVGSAIGLTVPVVCIGIFMHVVIDVIDRRL